MVIDGGADPTGSAACDSIFAGAIAAGHTFILFPIGTFTFTTNPSFTLPNAVSGLTIVGAGQEATVINQTAGGWTFNYSNAGNSVHVRDMTFTTNLTGTYNGLNLVTARSIVAPSLTAGSDVSRCTFRGSDGFAQTNYFFAGVSINNTSNISIIGCEFVGSSTSQGGGISIFGSMAVSSYAVNENINSCVFANLATAVLLSAFVQNITLNQFDVTNCKQGVVVGAGLAGTLQNLVIAAGTVSCTTNCISIATAWAGVYIDSVTFYIADGGVGISVLCNEFQIVGGSIQPISVSSGAIGVQLNGGTGVEITGFSLLGFGGTNGCGLNIVSPTANGVYTACRFSGNTTNLNLYAASTTNNFVACTGLLVQGVLNTVPRLRLTGNITLYVRTDGNDSNNGLADNSSQAFLTWQAAFSYVVNNWDTGGHQVTIQQGSQAGVKTYAGTAGVPMLNVTAPWVGGGTVQLLGDTSTPSNVLWNTNGAVGVQIAVNLPGQLTVTGFKITNVSTTAGTILVFHNAAGQLSLGVMDYGTCLSGGQAGAHIQAAAPGGFIVLFGNYNVSGNANNHLIVTYGAVVTYASAITVTSTGTPTIFCWALTSNNAFLNAATGISFAGVSLTAGCQKFSATANSTINTNGSGVNYFPGSAAGTPVPPAENTGGIYL
jgi:hypothetical protein